MPVALAHLDLVRNDIGSEGVGRIDAAAEQCPSLLIIRELLMRLEPQNSSFSLLCGLRTFLVVTALHGGKGGVCYQR